MNVGSSFDMPLFRRSSDAQPSAAASQSVSLPPITSFPAQDQSDQTHTQMQRWLSRLTGLQTGFDASQRLQLSITTSQGDARSLAPNSDPNAQPSNQAEALLGPGAAGAREAQMPHAAEAAEGGRAAEAAELHRLSTSQIDIRQIASGLERGLPFVVLLLIVFVSQHAAGLLCFGWLTYVLHRMNKVIRSQVAAKDQLQPAPLLAAAGLALVHVPLVCLVTWRQKIWRNLTLLMGPGGRGPTEFWDVLFVVVVADCLMRYITVLVKVAVLLVHRVESTQLYRRRSHVLTAVEYCGGLYRGLLPVPLWYGYFQATPHVASFLSTICSGVYVMLKCGQVYERLAAVGVAVRQAWQQSTYGSRPSQEDIAEAGNSCPICQDHLRGAIKLQCGHIYCEDCVSEWFERERTCPMCRAVVRPTNLKSHGDGHTALVPILF